MVTVVSIMTQLVNGKKRGKRVMEVERVQNPSIICSFNMSLCIVRGRP